MWSLTDASPERFREVAREIDASGNWKSFLTPQEHQIFEVALNHNAETWRQFIMGRLPCKLRVLGADDENIAVTDIDSVSLAFRVRYMLWESKIDTIDLPEVPGAPTPQETHEHAQESLKKSSNLDADDYDDDYDEGDEEGSEPVDASKTDMEPLPEIFVDTKQEDSEPDAKGKPLAVQNSSRMYDTFDLDLDKLKRFQRLKESDDQIQRENMNEAENGYSSRGVNNNGTKSADPLGGLDANQDSSITAFAKTAQFGSANLCLKHLLTRIEAQRSEMQVTDIELRNLISDVRKNRSKWASEERVGQEELYEACERVVQELRGTTESSTAFLNKVSKREAPNYYDIIKEPMDLNTVMRKLRALQYNSKTEFLNDLNLIWSNCLTYNSDPEHFLRVHAIAMRKKTQALAPLIPNVTIRSRAEVEAEAEIIERHAKEQKRRRGSDSDTGLGSKRKFANSTAPLSNQTNSLPGSRDISVAPDSTMDVDASFIEGLTDDKLSSSNDLSQVKLENENNENDPQAEESSNVEAYFQKSEESVSNDAEESTGADQTEDPVETETGDSEGISSYSIQREDFEVPDVETAMWNSATRRRRVQCITGRQALFKDNKLQMDAPVMTRSQGSMNRFDKAILGEDVASQMTSLSLLSSDSSTEPFMAEYEIHSGLPPVPTSDNSAWITAPVPKPEELPPSRYLARGSLNELINKNLNEMQMIRRLCAKINYIRDLQSGQLPSQVEGIPSANNMGFSSNPATIGMEYGPVKDPEEDISSRLPGASHSNANAAFSSMRRAISKIFMHAGYESAQASAVDCITAVAGDFMQKLATTLVSNIEAPNSSASFSSLLTGSLEEMGVPKLSQLTKYIADNVLRQGRRLATFRSRLNSTLEEILRPELERYRDEQFQENSDQFVFGQFSNELGDDYFGFKELGIDKELSVASIVVPFHLLQQRASGQDPGIAGSGRNRHYDFDVPDYSPINSESLESLPILVRDSLKRILLKPFGFNETDSVAKLSEIPQPTQDLPDAYVESVFRLSETEKGANKNKASKASKKTGSTDVKSEDAEDSEKAQVESQNEHFAYLASQASNLRVKLPSNNRLTVRKRRFDNAPILVKAEKPKILENKEDELGIDGVTSDSKKPSEPVDAGTLAHDDDDADNISNADDIDAEINNEIGSLVFGDDPQDVANGFAFDDPLDNDSFVMHSNYDADEKEDDDNGEGASDLGFQL